MALIDVRIGFVAWRDESGIHWKAIGWNYAGEDVPSDYRLMQDALHAMADDDVSLRQAIITARIHVPDAIDEVAGKVEEVRE